MQTQQKQLNERRSFLKKAAYVAPAIIALGTLTEASAGNGNGNNGNGNGNSGNNGNPSAAGQIKKNSTSSKIL